MPFVSHSSAYSVTDMWWFMQAYTSKTRCDWHFDLEQHMLHFELCICVGILSSSYLKCWWELLFCDNLQTHLRVLLLGRALLIGTSWEIILLKFALSHYTNVLKSVMLLISWINTWHCITNSKPDRKSIIKVVKAEKCFLLPYKIYIIGSNSLMKSEDDKCQLIERTLGLMLIRY